MLALWGKISQNYAWELAGFYKFRPFSDGITFLEFQLETDWYAGDHNPRGTLALRVLNFTIFEFEIYNRNHVEDREDCED